MEAILLAAAFAVAHTQSPLYFSNQNQYLLHGAALAHHGHLDHDWLATTRDPTPVFSLLVAAVYSVNEWLLQPIYFAMLMGYFLSARWLVAAWPHTSDTLAKRLAFAALFALVHAGIVRWASVQVTGGDYPWLLQAGLAAQYMVGPGIQPSSFGILLLTAVAAFAHDRKALACALAAGACVFHATYLLPAGLLVLGFLLAALNAQVERRILLRMVGISVLLMALPAVHAIVLMGAPGAEKEEALRILARVRIPHHCVAARWFDWLAVLQLVWMAVGWVCLGSRPVQLALFVAGLGGIAFTVLQLITGSDSLALAFPWRLSVLLVPVATAMIFALLAFFSEFFDFVGKYAQICVAWGAGAVLMALVASGIVVTVFGLGYRMVDEREIYGYIHDTATPDDVYLIPTQFPKVGTGRGAVSNTFAPPPRANPDTNQIPVDLQRFRLATGARIYVDFKSVPYAPAEVLEWNRRMEFAIAFYSKCAQEPERYHKALIDEKITRVVTPESKPLAVPFLEAERGVGGYIVYRVR